MKIYFTLLTELSFLIISTNSIEDKDAKKYLIFPFERNLTLDNSMTPEQFFETEIYNQIYINISVGSNKQNIPFYLYLQQYPIVIQSSNAQNEEVKGIYDEKKSDTYKQLSKNVSEFKRGDLLRGILSEDIFYFNSESLNIDFYLSVKNYPDSHINEGGKIGFRYFNEYNESPQSNFVIKLKNLDRISSYDISILYDSNKSDDDIGKLIVGALPHEIYNKRYDKSDIKTAYSSSYGQWEIPFEQIALGNKIFDRQNAVYFYPEFGFIVGTFNFFDSLNISFNWYALFNTDKCHSYEFQIEDIEANDITRFLFMYTGYYCDKDVNIDNIINESLSFKSTKFEYNFILNNKDLWMEKNGYKFFLILKTLNNDNSWIMGKPFFKRFHMGFNLDSKIMFAYPNVNFDIKDDNETEPNNNNTNNNTNNDNSDNNNNNNNKKDNTFIYIFIISGLIIIIGVFAFILIRNYIYAPRKQRANELLDDNFEYKQGENQENIIMPGEGINDN